MSQEKPEPFNLEQFNLEFEDKASQLASTKVELDWREGEEPTGEERNFLEKKFERLYKETISLLAAACIASNRDPEIFKKVTELMNLWISPDNDIPVFFDRGAGVLKDFTDELLKRVASPEEEGSRGAIEGVLQGS